MNVKRFKIGQEVTPKKDVPWHCVPDKGEICVGPRFGEVYTVVEYKMFYGDWFVALAEFSSDYVYQNDLDPVVKTSVLEKELNEITVGV